VAMHEIVGVDLDAMWRELLAFHHRLGGFEILALLDDDGHIVPFASIWGWKPPVGRPRQRLRVVSLGPEPRRVAHLRRLVGIACCEPGSLGSVLVERGIEVRAEPEQIAGLAVSSGHGCELDGLPVGPAAPVHDVILTVSAQVSAPEVRVWQTRLSGCRE
jgi:hypothetical protein